MFGPGTSGARTALAAHDVETDWHPRRFLRCPLQQMTGSGTRWLRRARGKGFQSAAREASPRGGLSCQRVHHRGRPRGEKV